MLFGHALTRRGSLLRTSPQPAAWQDKSGLTAVMEALEQGVAVDRVLVDRDHDTSALRPQSAAVSWPSARTVALSARIAPSAEVEVARRAAECFVARLRASNVPL